MLTQVHSCYSLKYGILTPKELLEWLSKAGYRTVALTDINNTSAIADFTRMAPEFSIHAVSGIDFRNSATCQFVGLAQNARGYTALNQYLSFHLHQQLPIPERAIPMADTFIIYPFKRYPEKMELENNEYIGVSLADLNKLRFSSWIRERHKLVLMQPFSFRHQRDFNTHRLLRAIDQNELLSKLPAEQVASPQHRLIQMPDLIRACADFSFLVLQAQQLLEKCQPVFDFNAPKKNQNQATYTGNANDDVALIRKLCEEGMPKRYPRPSEKVLQRIEKELEIIQQKDFLSYFLINHDIVQYARHKNYFYVGRGSGANSVIAYLLRITDVDPIELDLYFERFINLYRNSPPDFDIDFSWTDREDMTRYIFNRFKNTTLMGTYNTFQYRAVVRELGKVFGLPPHELEALSAGKKLQTCHQDEIIQLIFKYGHLIQDKPAMLSVHSSGIIISQQPIYHYCATFLPPKGFPVTQFDMVVAEDLGLYKFDILSQRGLSKIKDCLQIIEENRPQAEPIDIHDINRFKQDEQVKSLLREGRALGCFYVESPAMRMLLKKLLVDDYLGLVAASSIIRPGVSKSGMMKEYILRHRYPEKRKEAHPVMLSIMPETYGVMVYQEDVIKVAHYFAGLSLAEADVLRRGMSGKYRSREEFAQVEQQFFSQCKAKGYSEQLSREVWRQIASFAGYAFAKGHSASYAVESYQSLFLKAHYPLEYMVAVINNFGGFYSTEMYVHEARMLGATIEAPCLNHSDYHTKIVDKTIYLGLMHLSNLETSWAMSLLADRDQNGAFVSLEDFFQRLPSFPLEQLLILIRIGAFRFTQIPKRTLLWQAHLFQQQKTAEPTIHSLFKPTITKNHKIPKLYQHPLEDAFDELELLGFPLCNPFFLLSENTPGLQSRASDLAKKRGEWLIICGYVVTVKDTSSSKGERMNFGTFSDIDGHFFDTVHFPDVAKQYPFRGKGVYELYGRVSEEFGFYSLEVSWMRKVALIEDPRYAEHYPKAIAI